uniref:Rho-GAP domain-containing protein n=1 Tax=Pygocentrus nattereri TaxID=42514 RepID=A0AAR2IPJ7_PYGNA
MTPQQGAKLQTPLRDNETCKKTMKTTVQRRHTTHTVIRAFSKSRHHSSDAYRVDHMSPNAVLLLEDHAHLTVGLETRERLLLLFTDSLIIAKTKSLYLKLKARVSLCDVWLASCIQHVASRKFSAKNSFVIGWPTTNYVVTLSSSETKEKWLRALQWHSGRARQSFIPNRILLNVHLFDNTAGSVSNYQLCTGHDGEEDMYPLIGHELPFCILLHTLRSAQGHAPTPSLQQPSDGLSTDHLQKQPKSLRFVLKTRPAENVHSHTGSSLKHKRKKSLIGWALRRGYNSQSEKKNDSDSASNKLFGIPLASVCQDGNLPRPIMDILCVLYHEGPKTLGIFRRSANAKSCRVLKERLNSGHHVPLHGESVFTAASLLTEFLRRLPDSVLGCELYEDWMEVMEADDQEDRCTSAKSVLAKLPQVNRSLLYYVFGMLHCIHTNADVNQMTAANLALCIAPNMLWRSSPCSAEQENQNNLEVAALVRFLIECSPTIFGDEVESAFAALLDAAQETDDLAADATFLLQSSSEETDQDGLSSPLHSPDLDSFLPLTTFHREVHPLKITMAAAGGAYSCGTLNLKTSRSSASVCSLGNEELSQSRNRCLSEPSMCMVAPATQVSPHVTVLRQSSCDNSVMYGKSGRSQDMAGFSPLLPARKGGTGKGRYAFWKSPQFSTRFRHPAQRLASMSSLSSTTTTSSLSSLDSALSFSSTEPIPSPGDNQPRPFLFGASARLRPLTPEMPRKLWKMAFTYEEREADLRDGQNGHGEQDFPGTFKDEGKAENKGEEDGEGSPGGALAMGKDTDVETGAKENELGETLAEEERVQNRELLVEVREKNGLESSAGGVSSGTCPSLDNPEPFCHTRTPGSDGGISQEITRQLMPDNEKRETSVAHIHLERPLSNSDARISQTSTNKHNLALSSGREGGNRMKITFFPTVGRVMLKPSLFKGQESRGVTHGVVADVNGAAIETETGSVAQVNIPQTLFYRQNVPLVLHSASLGKPPARNEDGDDAGETDSCVSASKATEDDAGSGLGSTASTDGSLCAQDLAHGKSAEDDNVCLSGSKGHTVGICRVDSVGVSPSHVSQPAPSKSPGTLRHTIRIRLPTNVRNTVRAYFSHTHTISLANADSAASAKAPTKAQNRPLFSSKLQWQKAGGSAQVHPEGGAAVGQSLSDESLA